MKQVQVYRCPRDSEHIEVFMYDGERGRHLQPTTDLRLAAVTVSELRDNGYSLEMVQGPSCNTAEGTRAYPLRPYDARVVEKMRTDNLVLSRLGDCILLRWDDGFCPPMDMELFSGEDAHLKALTEATRLAIENNRTHYQVIINDLTGDEPADILVM